MKIRTLISLVFISICQSVWCQIASDGNGRISIGPPVANSTFDLTVNEFKMLYWSTAKTDLRIELVNDYRATIGSNRSLQERFYNPITKEYNIITTSWTYTNTNPPRVEPDNFPTYGGWYNMIKQIQPSGIYEKAASDTCKGYTFMAKDAVSANRAIFKYDENGILFFSTTDLLSVAVGASHEIEQQMLETDAELEYIASEVNRIVSEQQVEIRYEADSKTVIIELPKSLVHGVDLHVSDINGVIVMRQKLLPGQSKYTVSIASLDNKQYVVSLIASGNLVLSERISIK